MRLPASVGCNLANICQLHQNMLNILQIATNWLILLNIRFASFWRFLCRLLIFLLASLHKAENLKWQPNKNDSFFALVLQNENVSRILLLIVFYKILDKSSRMNSITWDWLMLLNSFTNFLMYNTISLYIHKHISYSV